VPGQENHGAYTMCCKKITIAISVAKKRKILKDITNNDKNAKRLRRSGDANQIHIFFYKQPHFRVEPRVAIKNSQNEAQSCYEVAKYFWNRGSRLLSCLTFLGSNVWRTSKNSRKLLRISIWKLKSC
jgi:hypothetical protein